MHVLRISSFSGLATSILLWLGEIVCLRLYHNSVLLDGGGIRFLVVWVSRLVRLHVLYSVEEF